YHWPLMFHVMPRQYSIAPENPGGVISGHRPGPSFLSKSTRMPSGSMARKLMDVVSGHCVKSSPPVSSAIACFRLNRMYWNWKIADDEVMTPFSGSLAVTRQKNVPSLVEPGSVSDVVDPPCSATVCTARMLENDCVDETSNR